MKKCSKCKTTKDVVEFSADANRKDGLRSWCRQCSAIHFLKYRLANREKIAAKRRDYCSKNKEVVAQSYRKYYLKNKKKASDYYKEYNKIRRQKDPLFKLMHNIRKRTGSALRKKNFKKNTSFNEYIGCSISFLAQYLESKFQPGMFWENYGDWEVDHIVPLASAKTESEVMVLSHYSNLQPLWAMDNLKKGAKMPTIVV